VILVSDRAFLLEVVSTLYYKQDLVEGLQLFKVVGEMRPTHSVWLQTSRGILYS